MPGLSDIEKELYSKNPQLGLRPEEPQLAGTGLPGAKAVPPKWDQPPQVGLPPKTKKLLYFILGGFGFLIVLIITVTMYLNSRSFALDKVEVAVQAPSELASGSTVAWRVTINNKNKTPLQGAQLDFFFPEGAFEFSQGLPAAGSSRAPSARELLGDVSPFQSVERSFKARLIGAKEDNKFAKAVVSFTPPGVNARVEKQAASTTRISSVPIALTVEAPNQLLADNEINYLISYFNASEFAFADLTLRVEYPPGFTFIEAEPAPGGLNSAWTIATLAGSGQGTVKIRGTLSGERDEVKPLKVVVETKQGGSAGSPYIKYTEAGVTTQILGSPLALSINLNGQTNASVDIGGTLEYTLRYENTLDVPLEDVTLLAQLVGNIFDLKTLRTNGAFDVVSNTISWGGLEQPELKTLKPNSPGQASFSIRLRDRLPILDASDKNFTVKVVGSIDTKKVPPLIGGSRLERTVTLITKVNSRLVAQPKIVYRETSSSIQNYGPVPPQIGQTTTYTVHIALINVANDLADVEVRTTLPTGAAWTGQYTANAAREGVSYDPGAKTLTWQVGRVVATTGIAQPTKELVYQVSVTPGPSDRYRVLNLTGEIVATGADAFTGATLTSKSLPLTTADVSDADFRGDGAVQ